MARVYRLKGQIMTNSKALVLTVFVSTGCTVKVEDVEVETLSQFWKADTTITIESNQMQLNEEYWVQRYTVPDTNTLFEDWVAIDGTLTTYEFSVDLSEQTFTVDIYMNEELDASGEGVFESEGGYDPADPWNWSYLEYGFTQSDGVSVVTVANIAEDSIEYSRVGYGMAGGADWTVDDVLTGLDEGAWRETLPE